MLLKPEILILGGGVIGLCIARELFRSGVRRITVIERGTVGREASSAAAGMLAPNAECEAVDDFYRFCDGSRAMYPGFADALLAETGVDIELDQTGTLYAAFSEADSAHLAGRFERQKAARLPVERLSAADTLKAEPGLALNVRESLYFPNDWQVENRKLIEALQKYAAANGVEAVQNTAVDSLIVENGRVIGAAAGAERFWADVTVLATGAWTSLIKIEDAFLPVDVKPIRGQMISFRPPGRLFRRVIYSPRGYLVPRADGRVLIGATVEDVGFDKSVTASAVSDLRKSAAEIAPALGNEEVVESWAGLRPFAADGFPVIGALDGLNGVFVATAHYRNGILLAPISAKILAENIVAGITSPYLDLFGPQRMLERKSNAKA